jgi:hypothetical protein
MDGDHTINLLFRNKSKERNFCSFFAMVLFFPLSFFSQIANYVGNGSFEVTFSCSSLISQAKYWNAVDSVNGGFSPIISSCYGAVPLNNVHYQWPRTGNNYIRSGFFCQPPTCSPEVNRLYLRNRLRVKLQAGVNYCVKYYVNIDNTSTYGIDGFGAYFGDNTLDTIVKTTVPLTYLTPQVQNAAGNILIDTLNWTAVSGTFVANGTEKFLVIGNFKSDAATGKTFINPTYSPGIFCDVMIDDVSCIPLDLPAYAAPGPDIWAIPGTTTYIGRPQDVGIDEACEWFKLPNTTSVIANVAGLTLTVAAGTETYMVKQDICGVIKYDTVVVHASNVGAEKFEVLSSEFKVYPQPANDKLTIECSVLGDEDITLRVFNHLGQLVREEEIVFRNKRGDFNIVDLSEGIYTISALTQDNYLINKKLVISR